jgi:hypothetical protein
VLRIKTSPDGKWKDVHRSGGNQRCSLRFYMICGKKFGWSDIPGCKETISGAYHSYFCTGSMDKGSMDKDPQIGDTIILHKAGCIIREAVENGIESEKKELVDSLQPGG